MCRRARTRCDTRSARASQLLIVEDDAGLRELFVDYFRECGYRVAAVPDGNTALAIVQRARPALVVLDLARHDRDDKTMGPWLRALFGDVPVVMVTTCGDETRAERWLGMGALNYVPKPFVFERLEQVVKAALRS